MFLIGVEPLVRGWVGSALRDTELGISGEAEADEAPTRLERQRPDLVLADADEVGPAFVQALRSHGIETPVLLMTASPRRGFNETARAAGAQGTIVATGKLDALLTALRRVREGGTSFDPRHPQRPPNLTELSPRERDVLVLVAKGETNRQIAAELGIGVETVKTLLARSCAKLGVHRRAEAVNAAQGLGFL